MKRITSFFLLLFIAGFIAGCAAPQTRIVAMPQAIPVLEGSYHQVRHGETLWRIARSFGLDVKALAAANHLPNANRLEVGQKLFVPLPQESSRFLWPVLGAVASSRASDGLDIRAEKETWVRAARSGFVAVSTPHLSGWGKTVVIDHGDGYRSIYAGLERISVGPRAQIRQGMPIGVAGLRPVHFEIRYGTRHKNALALLPKLE